jgi:hypothetical protein
MVASVRLTGLGAGLGALTGVGAGCAALTGAGAGCAALTGAGAGCAALTGAGAGCAALTGAGAGCAALPGAGAGCAALTGAVTRWAAAVARVGRGTLARAVGAAGTARGAGAAAAAGGGVAAAATDLGVVFGMSSAPTSRGGAAATVAATWAADVWPRMPEDLARCSAEQLASPRAAVRAAAVIATGVILMWISSVKDACSDADERFEAWRICTPARSMSAPWCGDAMTALDRPEASCRAGWDCRHTSRGSGDDNEAVYRRRLTCPRGSETPSFGRAARRTAGLRSPSTCSFPPFPKLNASCPPR